MTFLDRSLPPSDRNETPDPDALCIIAKMLGTGITYFRRSPGGVEIWTPNIDRALRLPRSEADTVAAEHNRYSSTPAVVEQEA